LAAQLERTPTAPETQHVVFAGETSHNRRPLTGPLTGRRQVAPDRMLKLVPVLIRENWQLHVTGTFYSILARL
jgi:hypothetical protein